MLTQAEKGRAFRALHERDRAFIIPNPWDIGTARLLAHLGFEALATTSAGYAFSIGQRDNTVGRDKMMAHVRDIAGATDLPVSADLENGFGDSPETAAETIRLAAAAGLVGGSIEDASGDPRAPIYALGQAVERVAAAAEAAHRLRFPFTLTARAENFLHDKPDLDDTVRRLQAFERAGADVLFAPGLPDLAAVRIVCSALAKPVNFMVGIRGRSFALADLAAAGVRRVSLSTSLYRAAITAVFIAAREAKQVGTFGYVETLMKGDELTGYLRQQALARNAA